MNFTDSAQFVYELQDHLLRVFCMRFTWCACEAPTAKYGPNDQHSFVTQMVICMYLISTNPPFDAMRRPASRRKAACGRQEGTETSIGAPISWASSSMNGGLIGRAIYLYRFEAI